MRLRRALAGLAVAAAAALVAGCVVTMSYDDFGDQKSESDAGGDAQPCVPRTCADQNANCGEVPDECGKVLSCGECTATETCGAGGPNRCGTGECIPKTCNDLGAFCGAASDGCGKTLDCGTCSEPKTCVANKCSCASAVTCEQMGAECGSIDDGCGGTTDCGNCQNNFKCGGGDNSAGGAGQSNKCVCANDPCLNYAFPCGYVLDCQASTVLCPCQNGLNCILTPPSDVGTCG